MNKKKLLSAVLSVTVICSTVSISVSAEENEIFDDREYHEMAAFEDSLLEPAPEDYEQFAVPVELPQEMNLEIEADDTVQLMSDETSGQCGDNVYWELDSDGTLTISGTGEMWGYDSPQNPYADFLSPWRYNESIKSVIINKGVTSVANYSFWNCENLTNAELPDGITKIGYSAFYMCDLQGDIVFPKTVTEIGGSAFYRNINIRSIDLPNSLTSIGNGAFSACYSLSTIKNMPNKSLFIGSLAFGGTEYCSNDANWTDNVLYIGSHLIEAKTAIEGEYIIKSGTTDISPAVFEGCHNLTSVYIPDSVERIGFSAFNSCTSLSEINFPDSITFLGNLSFNNCPSLNKILYNSNLFAYMPSDFSGEYDVPDGITEIAGYAFDGCKNLTKVNIPDSVTSIGECAFYECSLSEINLSDKLTSIQDSTFYGSNLSEIEIPDGVTYIGDYSFNKCYNLTNITIPNSVKTIDYNAFDKCTKLKDVYYCGSEEEWNLIEIDESNTYLTNATIHYNYRQITNGSCGKDEEDDVIWNFDKETGTLTISGTGRVYSYNWGKTPWNDHNKNIKEIVIENGITEISGSLFGNCSSVKSIDIPRSVMKIGYYTFSKCSDLTVTIPYTTVLIDGSAFYNASDIVIRGYTNSAAEAYANEKNITFESLGIMPEEILASGACGDNLSWELDTYGHLSITGEGDMYDYYQRPDYEKAPWYEYYNSYIKNVSIDGASSIGEDAFLNCSNITDIICGEGLINIGADAFNGCFALTDITIPEGTLTIGNEAFYRCESLKEISIPASVNSIGEGVFLGCESLEKYIVDPDNQNYKTIDGILFSYDEKTLVNYPQTKGETKYEIPDGVEKLSAGAFTDCSTLINITIPDSVTEMGYSVFYGCTNLKKIKLPSTLTNIPYNAFCYCYNLECIFIPKTVTKIESWAFAWNYNLTDIYYSGSLDEWDNIEVEGINDINTTVHPYCTGINPPSIQSAQYVTTSASPFGDIKVTLESTEYDSTMITVFYKDDVMVDMETTSVSANDDIKSVPVTDKDFNEAKVFIWSSLDSMKPLCAAETINLTEE